MSTMAEVVTGYVWLAEKSLGGTPAEHMGLFSNPGRARKVCQDAADEYFGAEKTPPLNWLGDAGYASATYHHPCGGMFLFQVTRFAVDQEAS
jgi:hypothetical protein